MKFYKITYSSTHDGTIIDWAETKVQAEAMAKDSEFELFSIKRVDVPTDKVQLLRWLRDNISTDNG